jgi:hypothetical protein
MKKISSLLPASLAAVAIALFVSVVLTSCSIVTTGGIQGVEFDRDQFDRERTAWEALDIDAYQYTQNFASLTTGIPLKITVAAGKKVGSEPIIADDQQFLQGESGEQYCFADTINAIFDRIESDIARDTVRLQNTQDDLSGISVIITYDSQYHYPMLVDYDLSYSSVSPLGKSNGYTLTVSDLSQKPEAASEPFDSEVFAAEKAAWEAQNSSDYQFVMQMLLDMPTPPVEITVSNGAALKTECPENFPAETFENSDMEFATAYGKTIPEIYASIDAVIKMVEEDKNESEHDSVMITISYNEEYHYPTYFFYTEYYDDNALPGGSIGIEISSFDVLD